MARVSKVFIVKLQGFRVFVFVSQFYTRFLVVSNSLFEEVGLPLQGNHVHPLEGVLYVVVLGHSQREKKAIRNKLDVLRHE